MSDPGVNAPPWPMLPWQRRVERHLRGRARLVAVSCPRGAGKSAFMAWLAARSLRPGDHLHQPGAENVIVASSVGQARRTVFRLLRETLPATVRVRESREFCEAHGPDGTSVVVLPSTGRRALGLVRARLVLSDEPASHDPTNGELLRDALVTSLGKSGTRLQVVFAGTLAPAPESGWWPQMLREPPLPAPLGRSVLVQASEGRWRTWREVRRVNPLLDAAVLRAEHGRALRDPLAAATFRTWRLNLPSVPDTAVPLPVALWERVVSREWAQPAGRPVAAVVPSGGRGWLSVAALWPCGEVEVSTWAPGDPPLDVQEARDGARRGSYPALGVQVVEGRQVPPVEVAAATVAGWRPVRVFAPAGHRRAVADALRRPVLGTPDRREDATAATVALRRRAESDLRVNPDSQPILAHALSVARLDAAGERLDRDNHGRDRCEPLIAVLHALAGDAQRPAKARLRWAAG